VQTVQVSPTRLDDDVRIADAYRLASQSQRGTADENEADSLGSKDRRGKHHHRKVSRAWLAQSHHRKLVGLSLS